MYFFYYFSTPLMFHVPSDRFSITGSAGRGGRCGAGLLGMLLPIPPPHAVPGGGVGVGPAGGLGAAPRPHHLRPGQPPTAGLPQRDRPLYIPPAEGLPQVRQK